jgi:hypothetical protein
MTDAEALLRAARYLVWWQDGTLRRFPDAKPPRELGEIVAVLERLARERQVES